MPEATSHTTVARQVARIGRHCLLFHRNLLQNKNLEEPRVVDGFETCEPPDPKALERGMAALLRPLVKTFPGNKLQPLMG